MPGARFAWRVCLALTLAALAAAAPGPAAEAGLARVPPGAERAVLASERFLGAPYVLSPLGEGSGPDPDPRFRLDAFDCVTLVETAIAFANAASAPEAARLLDDIRYDGPPDFGQRNHYLEAQWLPANVRKGWIAAATREIAGPLAVTTGKRLDAGGWKAAERAGHVLPGLSKDRRPVGDFQLDLVPLARVAEIAPRIPAGTILLVVREDRPRRPYRVTHLGIVVAGKDGARWLRHASDAPGAMRVRDERLDRFLARNHRYQGWPVSGVSLYAIRDNTARAREILSARPGASPGASAGPAVDRSPAP
jgi:hypothetical protein